MHEEEENLERWVISYADLLTLLFAFFVVMYAISTVNMKKYRLMSSSLHTVFNSQKPQQIYLSEKEVKYSAPFESLGKDKKPGFNRAEFEGIFNNEMMEIRTFNQDWVEIEMNSNLIFNSAEAEPKVKAAKKLAQIAKFLKTKNFRIVIEGYTDNVPISTVLFPSNWELSSARAAAVVRLLTAHGVKAETVTPVGFADLYPVASNATAEGRAKNRRVVIVIARDPTVERILNPRAKTSVDEEENNAKIKSMSAPKKVEKAKQPKPEPKAHIGKAKRDIPKPGPLPSGVESVRKPGGALIIRKKQE